MKISVKKDPGADASNAHVVTIRPFEFDDETYTRHVHTNENGRGLWIDGRQVEGTMQFSAGKNPAAAIRRYFTPKDS